MPLTTEDSQAHNSHNGIKDKSKSSGKTEKFSSNEAENAAKTTPQETTNSSNDTPQTSNLSSSRKEPSPIKQVLTREEFDGVIETIKDKYVLVWFSAGWCGPCKILAIKFEELAQKYRDKMVILKIDVDDLQDLALDNEVSTMPSYIMMRNGRKLAHYLGSKQEHIDELVQTYLEEKSN